MKKLYSLLLSMVFMLPTLMQGATFHGTRDDFRDETIYFAMTTRFYDGDPMNNVLSWDKQDVQIANNDPDWRGDFAGLIQKLDYIKALGFTAIWITPVTQNASGEDYHGYHSMDFSSVDLRYESRKEWGCARDVKFQDLIDAAHKKGIKIILDIVLNHTSNFGEAKLNPLFTRNQNIKNQATPAGALIPNTERLSANYFDQDGNKQYQERFKFFKNPQYDTHNMYHHYGTGWNWDLPNRWWGQIAGDCVDLNTENDAVAQYLVDCYGKFIEMGVDGFRIDTTGHIARLTFNTQFIPKFEALFEKYKNKRVDGGAYLMFGECCARFGGVIYRDQHNLSSHFYTWKSDQSLMNTYKSHSSQEWWDTQKLNEGHDTPVGPMIDCESEKTFNKSSNNVFMQNNAWHTPDYSQYSGFSVIDFPMHYNFNNAGSAINIAKQGDQYYNDASYNVVYVDSHDYCPGPNDGTRFNGGTAQWAENLSLMFTFRGIPCIYYGSEVEFMKGKPIDVGGENNKTPRKESGRAYFGHYLEGNVTASDFGVYTASGNVEKTLNGDLAHHIRMLNKIRAAVPALRKGQYTFDGCSGNIAFKRAYNKDGADSYACVAINGGATFNNVPNGTYVDLVTGDSKTVSNGTLTVTAPSNQGQLRVYVKGWTGGRVAEDGKFMYASSSKAQGGNPSFTDPGTTQYYTAKDVIGNPSLTFSPAGGNFKTETLTVTVKLNDAAESGWYKVGTNSQVNIARGETKTFTIGQGMAFGDKVSVSWGASAGNESYTGTVSYKKVDPTKGITVYVQALDAPHIYAWDTKDNKLNGEWPGKLMTDKEKVGEVTYYTQTFDDVDSFNIILSKNGNPQTADITGITEDKYFYYSGGTSYNEITDPAKGNSQGSNQGNNNQGDNNQGGNQGSGNQGSAPAPEGDFIIYFSNTCGWNVPWIHYWGGESQTDWPGVAMTQLEGDIWYYNVATGTTGVIFHPDDNADWQTQDLDARPNHVYVFLGERNGSDVGEYTTGGSSSGSGTDKPETQVYGWHVYFDNSNSQWDKVYAYIWKETGNGVSELLGSWPGTLITEKHEETGYHHHVIDNTKDDLAGYQIIFNNGGGAQTGDGVYVENGRVYNTSGKTSETVETSTGSNPGSSDNDGDGEEGDEESTGVIYIEKDNNMKAAVWGAQGKIYIDAPEDMEIMVVRIDGSFHREFIKVGINIIEGLPHGLYIVNGVKVLI